MSHHVRAIHLGILLCVSIEYGASGQLLPPDADAKVPLTWSILRGVYLAPDGSRPAKLDPVIHQILVPAPNAAWNVERREYETSDGSRLPPIPHPVSGKPVIPAEAIDPYLRPAALSSRSPNGAGKSPVYFDPQQQSYIDGNGNKLTSWNDATHELIQPRPNVVWDDRRQQYVTRDGSPLPWINDSRGWEGIPAEAIDPTLWDSPKYSRTKPEEQKPNPLDRLGKQVNLHRQLDSYEKAFEEAQRRGARFPNQMINTFRRMREGIENDLRQSAPEALKNLETEKGSPAPKKESKPKERVHISRRSGFGGNRLSANEAAAGRQIASAREPQFNQRLLEEWNKLVLESPSELAASHFDSGVANAISARIVSLGDRIIQEIHRVNAASMDFESWERSRRIHEESMRLLKAARNADVQGVNTSVRSLLEELPDSFRQPAMKYLDRMDHLYQQEPTVIDPHNPPYAGAAFVNGGFGGTRLEHGNVVAGRLRAGITDVQVAIYSATADLFTDLIRANPELRSEIGGHLQRIDRMNDVVHEWGRAQSAIVEQYIRRHEDREMALNHAIDRSTGFFMPVPDVPHRLGGTMFPQPLDLGSRWGSLADGISVGIPSNGTLGWGSFDAWIQAERDEREMARLTRESWYETHRLGDMVAQRLGRPPPSR